MQEKTAAPLPQNAVLRRINLYIIPPKKAKNKTKTGISSYPEQQGFCYPIYPDG